MKIVIIPISMIELLMFNKSSAFLEKRDFLFHWYSLRVKNVSFSELVSSSKHSHLRRQAVQWGGWWSIISVTSLRQWWSDRVVCPVPTGEGTKSECHTLLTSEPNKILIISNQQTTTKAEQGRTCLWSKQAWILSPWQSVELCISDLNSHWGEGEGSSVAIGDIKENKQWLDWKENYLMDRKDVTQ